MGGGGGILTIGYYILIVFWQILCGGQGCDGGGQSLDRGDLPVPSLGKTLELPEPNWP